MPIVDLIFVGPARAAAQPLADALGACLGSPPGSLWLRLHELPAAHYAENHAPTPQPAPIFLRLLLRAWPPEEERARLARLLAQAVAQSCGDADCAHVHIEFAPPGQGRVAFGGEWR